MDMVNKDVTKVCIGKIEELPEQLGKTVYIEDKELAVFKLSDGSIRAIENRCPHKGGCPGRRHRQRSICFLPDARLENFLRRRNRPRT